MHFRRSIALLLAMTAAAAMLGGCTAKGPTAEEQCSRQSTYDQIIDLLAAQIAQARVSGTTNEIVAAASASQALKNVLKFELPTVMEANATTRKISCQAMMRVTADSRTQQFLDTAGLDINEVAPDHLQLRVRYSLQPTADTGHTVLDLEQASGLAVVAVEASIVAIQRIRNASGAASSMDDLTVQMNASAAAPESEDPSNDAQPAEAGSADQNDTSAAEPAPAGPSADDARAFAADYFEHSGGSADAALAWMASHYAATVRFYGKNISRSDLLKQKADYLRRWPERTYAIEPESITAECKPGQPLCNVAGIIDWSATSGPRNASASGKATFELTTLGKGNAQVIVAEDSHVISRDSTP